MIHNFACGGRVGIDVRRLRCDIHDFRHLSDRQADVDSGVLVHYQRDALMHEEAKAVLFSRERVIAVG